MQKLTPFLTSEKYQLYLAPIAAGIVIFLTFERFNLFPVLFLLPFLLAGMRALPLKQKLLAYWLMAMVTNLGGFNWVGIVARDYGGLPVWAALGLVVFFSIFNNLNFVLWAYLERIFGEKTNPFIIAVLFAVSEQLNPQVFPWYMGANLDSLPVFYQFADLFGVVGLSFLVLFLVHVPWWIWKNHKTIFSVKKYLFFAQVAFVLFLLIYGSWALKTYNNHPGPGKKSITVSVVQSNTSMEKFYGAILSTGQRVQEFKSILNLTKQAIEQTGRKTKLVVWPEGSVHFPILSYDRIRQPIANLAKNYDTYVICGSAEVDGRNSAGKPIYYNSLFYFNPQGKIVGTYRKIVLLAFGEYIPFLDALPFLQKWLPDTISNFTRGTEKPVFSLGDNFHWLPLICYEDIISGFIAGFNFRKADFMVNITNDGWFGKSSASYLHKQMARPRAVEYRKPIIRALNTGSSQIIDSAGRTVSKETALYTQEYINFTLNVPETPPVTLYAFWGNWPVYLLMLIVAVLWLRKKVFKNSGAAPSAST